MARKKKSSPNMSAEIRKILLNKPTASNKEVYSALTAKFGNGAFNEASCGVAVSNQRKKLGLSKSRSVKKRRPRKPMTAANAGGTPDLTALRAAKALLSAVNCDDTAAVEAIRQVHSLQLGD